MKYQLVGTCDEQGWKVIGSSFKFSIFLSSLYLASFFDLVFVSFSAWVLFRVCVSISCISAMTTLLVHENNGCVQHVIDYYRQHRPFMKGKDGEKTGVVCEPTCSKANMQKKY